jgi:hypothetical protein
MSGDVRSAGDRSGHTWRSIDLLSATSVRQEPPAIGGVLYPAKRALLSGERDSLKTWLALILAKAEMDAGYAVGWADLDAMGPSAILDRLRSLGASDETVSKLFRYFSPAERLRDDRLVDVCHELSERGARLFVVDAFNPFLSLQGLDPNSTPDVETFWREVADPVCRAGAAPLMLDHVVKNARSRSHYSYGSERKVSGAIVHLGMKLHVPFGRERVGASEILCHRDRQGYLPRPAIGRLELSASGPLVRYGVFAAEDSGRPTRTMEAISRYLATQVEPVSRNKVERNVAGSRDTVRESMDLLIAEGYATPSEGPRNARQLAHSRDYAAADDLCTVAPLRPRLLVSAKSGEVDEVMPATSPSSAPLLGARRSRSDLPATTAEEQRGSLEH